MGDKAKSGAGRFEPPPWELEAFEALARRRAEEQAALEAIARAMEPTAVAIAEPEPLAEPAVTQADEQVKVAKALEEQTAAKAEAKLIDERRVQAMLLELGREETASTGSIKIVARIASVMTAIVGIGMLTGGLMIIQRASGTTAGLMGSGALSVFGLCFVAMAAWVWVGSNRTRRSR
jgi:hypothetical protein